MCGPRVSHVLCLHSDVDDVHDMMDDISEQNEIAEEISSALSQPIGFNQEIDDVRQSCCHQHFLSFSKYVKLQSIKPA